MARPTCLRCGRDRLEHCGTCGLLWSEHAAPSQHHLARVGECFGWTPKAPLWMRLVNRLLQPLTKGIQ